jgi:DUF4097 and DUF4098 domain-containing protein YvlB
MTTASFPLTGSLNLLARLGHGTLTVTAEEGRTEATVTITGDDHAAGLIGQIAVELRGPTLSIIAPRQGGIFDLAFPGSARHPRANVDVAITVPSGTALKITTVSAQVRVAGRCGGADIACGASTVALEHVDGNLRLRLGQGSATVAQVSGSVEFRSGAGSATLGAVHGDVDLASGSGNLAVGLPVGQLAHLDITAGSGSVNSELPVDPAPAHNLHGPVISVRARTGSGDIQLFRAA